MSSSHIIDISTIFGEVLRRHRSSREVSQEELAFLAGVDRTFISRLERGLRQPTMTTLIGIGLALGVPAADMVRETEREYLKQADLRHLTKQTTLLREKGQRYSRKRKGRNQGSTG